MRKNTLTYTFLFILLNTYFSYTFGQTKGLTIPFLLSQNRLDLTDSLKSEFHPDSLFSSYPILRINNDFSGSFISEDGLVLTTKKALKAKGIDIDKKTEKGMPLPGWFAQRQLYQKNVTRRVMEGIDSTYSALKKNMAINRNRQDLIRNATTPENTQLEIEAINGGREFVLYAWENFSDLRLVEASPEQDHILLQVYRNDKIYRPEEFLKIDSTFSGNGGWTASLGYPQRSFMHMLPLRKIAFLEQLLPNHLRQRKLMLEAWEEEKGNLTPRLSQQLERLKKEQDTWEELSYQSLILYIPARLRQQHNKMLGLAGADHPYRQQLERQKDVLEKWAELENASLTFDEILNKHLQLFRLFEQIIIIRESYSRDESEVQERLKRALDDFYRSFKRDLEVELLEKALTLYFQNLPTRLISPSAGQKYAEAKKDLEDMARIAFASSLYFKPELLQDKLRQGVSAFMDMTKRDYLFNLWQQIEEGHQKLTREQLPPLLTELRKIQEHYHDLLAQNRQLLPEAQGHLRLSIGQLDPEAQRVDHHLLTGMEGAPLINQKGEILGIFTSGDQALLDLGEWIYEEGLFEWEILPVEDLKINHKK